MKNNLNHIAFIMDGNGRWAQKKNLKRIAGHDEGSKRIPEIIDGCIQHNIKFISFFCFSTENWKRPKTEVSFLVKKIFNSLSNKNLEWFNKRNIRVNLIGFSSNMPISTYNAIKKFCDKTAKNDGFFINFYFNYGSKQEIIYAIKRIIDSKLDINIENFNKCLLTSDFPDVDLLIRTSGEQRISNFLLWQIAYAEIIFEKTFWPDYTIKVLNKNINEYNKRSRRFGSI